MKINSLKTLTVAALLLALPCGASAQKKAVAKKTKVSTVRQAAAASVSDSLTWKEMPVRRLLTWRAQVLVFC